MDPRNKSYCFYIYLLERIEENISRGKYIAYSVT